jgi:CBS domain-containing protein
MARRNRLPWTLAGGLPTVRAAMDKKVPVLRPEIDLLEATGFLLRHHVTGAPVVDDQGHLVGMLTEKDCLKLITTGADHDLPSGTVKEYMSTDVTSISPDTDLYFVAGLFLKSDFRRLPVVEDGKLVGAITRLDLLRAIRANLG